MAPPSVTSRDVKGAKRKSQHSQPRSRYAMLGEARVIATQASGEAFRNGQVDVDKFVKAREYEINALEQGMRRAKSVLTVRAFQTVPRSLRRRTASHDAKRVPKRLRAKARKEMADDNTPTGAARKKSKNSRDWVRFDALAMVKKRQQQVQKDKSKARAQRKLKLRNAADKMEVDGGAQASSSELAKTSIKKDKVKDAVLQKPPRPKARFRKRQIHKAWLPTHMFHAKRAHMTPPKEPLWRFAIPLSPTEKSYRPTHRASQTRGAIAWDMSYMATISLKGREKGITSVLKDLGMDRNQGPAHGSAKTRKWMNGTRSWQGWLYERTSEVARPIAPVTVIWCSPGEAPENSEPTRQVFLRVHPAGFLQLWNEIIATAKAQTPHVLVEDLRYEIGSIEMTGPSAMEAITSALWPSPNSTESHKASTIWKRFRNVHNTNILPADTLLHLNITDPRLHFPPRKSSTIDAYDDTTLMKLLCSWPPDSSPTPASLFSRKARTLASRALPSTKAIQRRRTLSPPGQYPAPAASDPAIPMILLAQHDSSPSRSGTTGTWTLLLPWRCVLPVWYSLLHQPLSTGGSPRFGGLTEQRQLAFERSQPWFPGDCPGTRAGAAWETREAAIRHAAWAARPRSKRIAWDSVPLGRGRKGELGAGWACDWRLLTPADDDKHALVQLGTRAAEHALVRRSLPAVPGVTHVAAVALDLLTAGVPAACARVYRLPTNDEELRRRWTELAQPASRKRKRKHVAQKPPPDAPEHVRRRYLASSLLAGVTAFGEAEHVPVPDACDLVGFVTAGNFNLAAGRGSGVAAVVLGLMLKQEERLCVVRNAGAEVGRLARWRVL